VKALTVLTLGAVLVAAPALAEPQVTMRWMGPESFSCGEWPEAAPYTRADKALRLNWVLGFLSAASLQDGYPDLLANVDNPSVAAWIDNYCAANPLDSIVTAAFRLRDELIRRERPAPHR
jgi:hypothetical protein